MIYKILRMSRWPLIIASAFGLCRFAVGEVATSATARHASPVSGTYQVLRQSNLGAQEQVRLRIHLVNRGPSGLSIRRMTIWDFAHADKGGRLAVALALPAHGSAYTTVDFTIRRMDFESWQRGATPRLVLEMAGSRTARSKAIVRLDRISAKEVN